MRSCARFHRVTSGQTAPRCLLISPTICSLYELKNHPRGPHQRHKSQLTGKTLSLCVCVSLSVCAQAEMEAGGSVCSDQPSCLLSLRTLTLSLPGHTHSDTQTDRQIERQGMEGGGDTLHDVTGSRDPSARPSAPAAAAAACPEQICLREEGAAGAATGVAVVARGTKSPPPTLPSNSL